MAETIILPKLGITMTEGTITKWLKAVGDYVSKGDALFEIESDKSVQEWECSSCGYLRQIIVAEGDTAAVAAPVCVLSEDRDEPLPGPAAVNSEPTPAPDVCGLPEKNLQPESSPIPKKAGCVIASPRARKYAREHSVDISLVVGSGEHGRIREKDVISYCKKATEVSPKAAHVPEEPSPMLQQNSNIIPYTGIRRTTGQRVHKSYSEKPHIYITMEVNMDGVLEEVEKLRSVGEKVSNSDFVISAAAKMLRAFPQFNAYFTDRGIELQSDVNIGYAVNTDKGLVVPVIRNVDMYNIGGIAKSRKAIVSKALEIRLKPDDMSGASFTISNMGSLGVKCFTSIINDPQVAILSVASVRPQLIAENKSFRIGNVMDLTIAVDHRAIDGAVAAKALAFIKEDLESR